MQHYLRRWYVRNGPTLPYLIGARLIVELQQPLLRIAENKRRPAISYLRSSMANPVWYVVELTKKDGDIDMDVAEFIQGAYLAFLHQVTIII